MRADTPWCQSLSSLYLGPITNRVLILFSLPWRRRREKRKENAAKEREKEGFRKQRAFARKSAMRHTASQTTRTAGCYRRSWYHKQKADDTQETFRWSRWEQYSCWWSFSRLQCNFIKMNQGQYGLKSWGNLTKRSNTNKDTDVENVCMSASMITDSQWSHVSPQGTRSTANGSQHNENTTFEPPSPPDPKHRLNNMQHCNGLTPNNQTHKQPGGARKPSHTATRGLVEAQMEKLSATGVIIYISFWHFGAIMRTDIM